MLTSTAVEEVPDAGYALGKGPVGSKSQWSRIGSVRVESGLYVDWLPHGLSSETLRR
jgi:hypothetical protein